MRAALIVALALGGCARTEMVVSIASTELAPPADFDRLLIKVTNPSIDPNGTSPVYAPPPLALCATPSSGCYTLPLTVTLYPGAHADEKVRVEVQALHGSDALPAIAQAAVFTFTHGKSERLAFDLYRRCLQQNCAQFNQGCDSDGACNNVAPVTPGAPPDMAQSPTSGMVTLLSSTTANAAAGASFAVPAPDNVAAGDLLVLVAEIPQNGGDPPSMSPGWTMRSDFAPPARLSMFTRIAATNEPTSYTFTTLNTNGSPNWSLLQFRGARGLDGIAAVTELEPFYAPSVTTTVPGGVLLTAFQSTSGWATCGAPAGGRVVASDKVTVATAMLGAAGPTGDRPIGCSPPNGITVAHVASWAIAPQ